MTELQQIKQIIALLDEFQIDNLKMDYGTDMRSGIETVTMMVPFKNHEQIEKIDSILLGMGDIVKFDDESNTEEDENFKIDRIENFEFDIINNDEIANYLNELKPLEKDKEQNIMYQNAKFLLS